MTEIANSYNHCLDWANTPVDIVDDNDDDNYDDNNGDSVVYGHDKKTFDDDENGHRNPPLQW